MLSKARYALPIVGNRYGFGWESRVSRGTALTCRGVDTNRCTWTRVWPVIDNSPPMINKGIPRETSPLEIYLRGIITWPYAELSCYGKFPFLRWWSIFLIVKIATLSTLHAHSSAVPLTNPFMTNASSLMIVEALMKNNVSTDIAIF